MSANSCIEFCRNRNKFYSSDVFTEDAWNTAEEVSPLQLCSCNVNYNIDLSSNVKMNISVKVDPRGCFNYYTQEIVYSDGTLLFAYEAMKRCIEKVLFAKTYNKEVGLPNLNRNSIVEYTIGNFVILNEFGNYDENRPWITMKSIIMLPINYNFKYC